MFHQLVSVAAFGILALAAFGLGRPILRGLGGDEEDRLSVVVWSVALGLIAAGMVWVGLGLIGALYLPLIGVITMLACFWGLGEIFHERLRARGRMAAADEADDEPPDAPWAAPPCWLLRGVLALAGVACLGSLVGALAPPTAGDALCYHLELPKRFLLEHRILHLPYHDNSTFPLLAEMWYLWALALDGGVCAQLVHWGLGVLLAGATVVLAAPLIGRRWGWIAGAVVLLTPGVNNQMTAPLNDVALAAMTTLALAAWWRAGVDGHSRRWFVIAGLAAGAALGTKYIALVFAAAVAMTWLWALVRRPQRRGLLLQGAAVVAVVASSVGGVWYVRAAWYRGNPVYPFFGEVLANNDDAADARETLPESKSPLGRSPLGLAAAPWQVTMQPGRFGGRGHQLGMLALAAVPGVVFCRRLRGLGTLLAVVAGYGVVWYLLRQNVRFLFPIVPLLSVVTVWVWIEMRRFPWPARWVAAATFAGVMIATAAVPLARCRGQWAVASGWEDRESYLLRNEPTYRAAAVANVVMKPDSHLLSQDYRGFHFNCRVTRENVYRRHTGYDRGIADPAELSRRLRNDGFTHLLLAETVAGGGIRYDPTLSRLADGRSGIDATDELFAWTEYLFRDSDGALRRYRLVELR